jgi:DamX protein
VQQRLAEAVARVEARREAESEAQAQAPEPVTPAQGVQPEPAPEQGTEIAPEPALEGEEVSEPGDALEPEPATEVESDPEPEPEPEPAPPVESDSGLLAEADDAEYTLQLVGVRDRAALEQIMAAQSTALPLEIVTATFEGRPWYVLIHGRYADAETARAAVSGLPAELRTQQPWARSFASLRSISP